MTDTVTWPADGATLQAGHIQFRVTRGPATGLFSWVFSGPRVTIWKTFDAGCPCNVGSTDLYMTPVGNNQFVWIYDASGLPSGVYEIDVWDPIQKWDPVLMRVDPSYQCPPTGGNSTVIHITLGGDETEQTESPETLRELCLQDKLQSTSETSPLSGNQSWSVPITSWAYRGATFSFETNYNSVSMVDPLTTDSSSSNPNAPLTTDFSGLSEKNSRWTHSYGQWMEVVHDETGAEYAVWHHGAGRLAFKKSGGQFTSPDAYHTITSSGSVSTTYPCDGLVKSVTVPYGAFTITDSDGTQLFFNQPQPGTGTHLTWLFGNCVAVPQYLLSRVQDRWGRAVNLTWGDIAVGGGTQKRVTAVRDGSSVGITLNYNEAPYAGTGLLTSLADPQSRTHSLGYTAVPDETLPTPVNRWKLSSITVKGPGSPTRTVRSWGFVYSLDSATNNLAYGGSYTGDLVIQKTAPDGLATSYRYEGVFLRPSDHARLRGEDWNGRVTRMAWMDGSEGGQTVEYAITRTLNSVTQATMGYPSTGDVPVNVQYNYSGIDLTSVVDGPTGRTWSYTYDTNHNLLTVRSPLEATGNPLVQFSYVTDSSGHITQRTAQIRKDDGSLGDSVQVQFNALNLPTQKTVFARSGLTQDNQVTQYEYDNGAPIVLGSSPGNLTKITEAVGSALQQSSTLFYDAPDGTWGLTTRIQSPVGATSSFDYDNATGRMLSGTSPQNLVAGPTDPDRPASISILQYNTDGLPSLMQDPLGHQVMISYNAQATSGAGLANLVITLTFADTSTRQVTLDPMGRTLDAKDEKGVHILWSYNPRGQVKTVTQAAGTADQRVTVYNYDCRGDLYRIQPPNGAASRVAFTYRRYNQNGSWDGTYEGQMTRIIYPDGTNEYFGYNGAGELAWRKKQDGTILTITSRDAQHRITRVDYPASQGNLAFSVTAAYDEFGREVSSTDLNGTTTSTYDLLNRIATLAAPNQKALTFTYTKDTTLQRWITNVSVAGVGSGAYQYQTDTKGRLAQVVNAFGQNFSFSYDLDGKPLLTVEPNGVHEERTYTARDWLASVLIRQANGTPIDTLSYYYTDASNNYDPTGHLQREVDAGLRTHAFFYDNVYQLRMETHPDFTSISYDFDLNGNRTKKTTNGTAEYYGVDANNKLFWVNQGTNGVPTSGQTNPYTLFTYDAVGRLTRRERKYSSTVSRTYDFFWDGDDRLRTVKQGGTSVLTAGYDGGGLRTSKSDSWTGVHTYTWGLGGIVYDNNTGVTTTPGLSKRQSGVDRFFHSDWLGSTRYLSDNSGNNFPSALRYDAFGGRSATGGSDPYDPTDFQFGGDWGYQTEYATATEPGVGLNYLRDRYYDPAIGRFVSVDPLGIAGGINAYQYVGNNPVGDVDPSGNAGLLDLLAFPLVGTPAAKEASDRYLTEHVSDYSGAGHYWAATKGFFGAFNPLNTIRELHDSAAGFGRALGCYESGHATGLDLALAGGKATVEVVGTALGIYSTGRGLAKSFAWLVDRCFVAGTPVVMADGSTKPIEQVHVGDQVLAGDEANGKVEARRVRQVFEREVDGTVALTFANGEWIETTENHPFYVEGRGFTEAGQLGIGTSIVTRAGPAAKLVQVERRSGPKKVYNFEVEDAHTYFVGTADGGLWVHNDCSSIALRRLFRTGEGWVYRLEPKSAVVRSRQWGGLGGEEFWRFHDVHIDESGMVYDPMRDIRSPIPLEEWQTTWHRNTPDILDPEAYRLRPLELDEINAIRR